MNEKSFILLSSLFILDSNTQSNAGVNVLLIAADNKSVHPFASENLAQSSRVGLKWITMA